MRNLRAFQTFLLVACMATAVGIFTVTKGSDAATLRKQAAIGATTPCVGSAPVTYRHIVFVIMENKDFSQIDGHAPYQNALAKKCGLATGHVNLAHPSLPNYLRMTAGTADGIDANCETCTTMVNSIFGQLGGGWKTYQESMPSPGYLGTSAAGGLYRKKHNPASFFLLVRTAYATRGVPMGSPGAGRFHNDVVNGTLPRYSFITPNMCHDTHDCSVATGNTYLASLMPLILNGKNYLAGDTLVVLTYDESGSQNKIYTTFIAPSVIPGTRSAFTFNHYGLLRLSESELGLPLLAGAKTASDPRAAFHL